MSNIQALKGFLLDRDTMESYLEVLKENDISVTSTNVGAVTHYGTRQLVKSS